MQGGVRKCDTENHGEGTENHREKVLNSIKTQVSSNKIRDVNYYSVCFISSSVYKSIVFSFIFGDLLWVFWE